MKKWFWCLMVVVVFALQCKKESTQWSPELAFPIAQGTLSLSDIVNPEYLDYSQNFVSLSIKDTLRPIDLSSLLNLGDTIIEEVYTPGIGIGPIPYGNSATIFTLDETFNFNLDQAEIRYAKVKAGTLSITFESTADGYLDLSFFLPGITLENESLSILGQTEPADEANYVSTISVDISGYEIDLTGEDGTERNAIYGELSVATSAEPEYTAQIYGADEIITKLRLIDVEFEEVRGFFGAYEEEINEQLDLGISNYNGGTIGIEEIDLELEIKNYLGVDALLDFSSVEAVNSINSNTLELEHPIFSQEINLTRAFEFPNYVEPDTEVITFTNENSNLADFVSVTPTDINLSGIATLNPLGDITGGNDFYREQFPLEILVDLEMPLCVSANGLTLVDSLDVSIDNLENLTSLVLNIHYENGFQLEGLTEVFIDSESLLSFELESSVDETDVAQETVSIVLSQEQIKRLGESQELVFQSVLNTFNTDAIKIQSDDQIELLITAVATYEASF